MNIKIFPEMYCGRKAPDDLGFIVPGGDNAAAKRRKETVDCWTRAYCKDTSNPEHYFTFPNTPTSGFEIRKVISPYRTSNKLFRVWDPRGFIVEISAQNLCELCLEGGVQYGVFTGSYVWGREGRDNVLLATGSPRFKEAFEFTKQTGKGNKVSLRSLKIGQKVSLLWEGTVHEDLLYVGRRWRVETPYAYTSQCGPNDIGAMKSSRYYGILNRQDVYFRRDWKDQLHAAKHTFLRYMDGKPYDVFHPSSPHVTKIQDEAWRTPEEAEQILQDWAGPPEREADTGYDGYSEPRMARLFTLSKKEAEDLVASRKDYLRNFQPVKDK